MPARVLLLAAACGSLLMLAPASLAPDAGLPVRTAEPNPWVVLGRVSELADAAQASRAAMPNAAPASAAALAALPAATADIDAEVPVCGLGRVRLDDQHPTPLDRVDAPARELAWRRLDTAMALAAEPGTRAAGLLWRVRRALPPERRAELAEADAACRAALAGGLAQTAEHCAVEQAHVQADALAPAADAADQLARLAQLSDDPLVQAFAQEACAPVGLTFWQRRGNCERVDAAYWARRMPRAAAPWLLLADTADAQGDVGSADRALRQATLADEIDEAAPLPAALALAALGAREAALSPLERTLVQADIATVAEPAAALGAADRLCSGGRLAVGARHGACDVLARLLVDRGRTEAALTLGLQIGERLGWPGERTAAAVLAQRAAADLRLDYLADGGQGLSCVALQRRRQLALRAAEVGEVAAVRQLPPR